ncbi:carbohydrate kinase family protein [candidate division KSB1 bacterium]
MTFSRPPERGAEVIIGVGGIGSGIFFELEGNHNLGREESRAGTLLDRADYCKLHIIFHYLAALLSGDDAPRLVPVGRVGNDPEGRRLVSMMADAGMDISSVQTVPDQNTLFSVCFQYPDGAGGNITTSNDAGVTLTPKDVLKLDGLFHKHKGKGIAVAAPEVPLEVRAALLELATAHKFFRAASFTTGEIVEGLDTGMFRMIDLVGLNEDEARTAAGTGGDDPDDKSWINRCIEQLWSINPAMMVSITLGAEGSVAAANGRLEIAPALVPPRVASTAGSGDAHLAGLVAGLSRGLPLIGNEERRESYNRSPLASAHDLALLVASMSVTSADTINMEINRETLMSYAEETGIGLSAELVDSLKL